MAANYYPSRSYWLRLEQFNAVYGNNFNIIESGLDTISNSYEDIIFDRCLCQSCIDAIQNTTSGSTPDCWVHIIHITRYPEITQYQNPIFPYTPVVPGSNDPESTFIPYPTGDHHPGYEPVRDTREPDSELSISELSISSELPISEDTPDQDLDIPEPEEVYPIPMDNTDWDWLGSINNSLEILAWAENMASRLRAFSRDMFRCSPPLLQGNGAVRIPSESEVENVMRDAQRIGEALNVPFYQLGPMAGGDRPGVDVETVKENANAEN